MEQLLPLLLIFGVMMLPMLWMSSRQRKVQRQQQELVSKLGIGDEVRTHSGFYGLIIEDLGDQVILETENGAQMKWDRRAISGLAQPAEDTDDVDEAQETEDSSFPAQTDTPEAAAETASGDFSASYDDDDRHEGPFGAPEGERR